MFQFVIGLLLSLNFAYANTGTSKVKSAKVKVLGKGETIGTFENFVWGDYPHIHIIANNKSLEFFADCLPCSVFEDHTQELKGKKIKISWQKVSKYVPEAGGDMEMIETKDICSYEPITLTSILKATVKLCKN